jgi:FtsX-like permease family
MIRSRLKPDGTFASRASVTDKIVLGSNGEFTSTGMVLDYDANGKLLTTGCFTYTATRLTAGFEHHGNEWNHWSALQGLGPIGCFSRDRPVALFKWDLLWPEGALLYEVKAYDPLAFLGAILLLAICATVAAFISARRAASIDPMQALRADWMDRMKCCTSARRTSLLLSRIPAELLSVYAISSVLVAMLGLYAVTAHSVIERHREFALRLALGSTRAAVFRLVLSGSTWTAVVGLVTGGLGSIAAVRLLRSMLFGVAPFDPTSYCAAVALLLITVFLSGLVPARRAASVEPMQALRIEWNPRVFHWWRMPG